MRMLGIEPKFSARTMNMNIYMNLKETLCLWPRAAFVKVKTKESALAGWSLSTIICVNVCVCSESALLLQRQDTSFMGEQVTKLYNSHFSWASRELALTAFCFPVVLGFCVGSAVFFLRHEDSL